MQHKLRILHVIPSISPLRGGPSKAIIEMVRALRKSGVDAEIATTNDHGPGLLDVPLNHGIDYQGVPVRFFKRFSPALSVMREFAYSRGFQQWLKQHIQEYDVIHVHAIFSFCSTYAMYLARKTGVPYIVRPIGQLEKWSLQQSKGRKAYYLRIIEKNNLLNAKAIHCTADSEQIQALNVLPGLKTHVIPLGLVMPELLAHAKQDLRQRWQLKDGIPILLYLSRLHPKKGIDILIEALAALQHPVQLLIAGEGEKTFKEQLNQQINTLGLSHCCHLIGFIDGVEKEQMLQGADLFVLSSHSENFGIAVLEAMASGTAVFVSEGVALSAIIKQHQLGYVSPLEVNAMASQLNTIVSDLPSSQKRGKAARHFVQTHYQWAHIAAQLKQLYQKVLNTHSV